MNIPRTPLILGLAGTLPFIWSALTVLSPDLAALTTQAIGPRFIGPYVGIFYGAVILSFMSGVLWGFATKMTGGNATTGYVLSVIPALWTFFTVGGGSDRATLFLIVGFAGILALDWMFWRDGAAPGWWMNLRLMITAIVVTCLTVTLLAS
ncbi:DUF3429 domain-containing protein [Roseovarius aestuariivivens]|uniref:DUF3429 domain-containing protein n=1 Tax=Roseovarius aestuariivivens TaxID=1888910 RepID=UPI00107FDE74|nr:DUF3429 domain-containing protein [Roseovarius aestuariivivens]